jgi:hypothetical protein
MDQAVPTGLDREGVKRAGRVERMMVVFILMVVLNVPVRVGDFGKFWIEV